MLVTDDNASVAKYYRIMQDIVSRIRAGELLTGAPVPSENDLIRAYKVSNTTARKALLELERGGWATRVKGRGTFVRDNRIERSATRILGFTRNMREAGRTPATQLLGVAMRRRGRSLTLNNRRYVLSAPLYEIRRLRFADGVPMMRETRWVSAALCPGIEKKDLQGSLYDLYEEDYGLQLSEIAQTLSAMIVDGVEMGFVQRPSQMPALLVTGVTFCAKELVLEVEESFYRGDMYRFSLRATR